MSETTYISFPIEVNPQDLLDEIINEIKAHAPAWVQNDANLDTWIAQIMASQAADLRGLAADVPDTIFLYFGAKLIGLIPIDATAARVISTWTMRDNAGYTIPAGTFVSIRSTGGEDIAFETTDETIIFAGSTVANAVGLVAVQPGLAGSGLGTIGGAVTLLDTLDFVTSVTQNAVTGGGIDAETATQYMDRLVRRLRLLSTRPILPEDFANLALEVPGIFRAVAIDGFQPSDDTYNHERTIAISAVDELGNDLDGAHTTALTNLIVANREVTFVVHVMNARRTSIDVNFTALAIAGVDPAVVQAAAIAAVRAFLDPANWGRDPRFTDSAQTWIQVDKVYESKLESVISAVAGIDRVTALTLNITGNAPGVIDVPLAKPATLTSIGTVTGTVS